MENKIKDLRKEKGLTQQELADEIGVSKLTILRWEQGQRDIKTEKAQQLADYFGVSVGYLLGYSEDKKDAPIAFNSPEEFERARAKLIEQLEDSDTKELALAYSGKELTGIIEKTVLRYDKEKEFLDNFFQLKEKDKTIIRYLVENLVDNKE
ncbi:DNA-binding protein [Streptococcus satellite phage Javan175]|uniref:helix-turn-helix domain-containing protein n=1 Tax=Streptococcus entericus TaxID=155680 RepID=UPI0003805B57|nr:helix-turn-helix transcriptional regulator [Streptococcus entericus]QBX07758.1 DNA-binding protein [Streptococcus satellite phage Javan175]